MNLRLGCGFHGSRWSGDYRDHRRWAARHPRYDSEQEVAIRKRMLRQCRDYRQHDGFYGRGYGSGRYGAGHYAGVEFARHYAETATRQAHRNLTLRCGYRGNRWTTHYGAHYDWARKNPAHRAESEIRIRERDLRQCRGYRAGY